MLANFLRKLEERDVKVPVRPLHSTLLWRCLPHHHPLDPRAPIARLRRLVRQIMASRIDQTWRSPGLEAVRVVVEFRIVSVVVVERSFVEVDSALALGLPGPGCWQQSPQVWMQDSGPAPVLGSLKPLLLYFCASG